MARMIQLLKLRVGRTFVVAMCASLLVATTPRRTHAQGLIEYADILAIIVLMLDAIDNAPQSTQQPLTVLGTELQSAVMNAQQANAGGNVTGQIAGLSQAIGLAQAMEGMTSRCDTCSDLTSDLDLTIELSSQLRAELVPHP